MAHNRSLGLRAENYFASTMNKLGIDYTFENLWFDFLVKKKIKVEVKSCQLTVKQKNGEKREFRAGRFDFTREENREKQYDNDIWVCFILRHNLDFMILGFARAKQLEKARYITPHTLDKFRVLNLDEWVIEIMNDE